MKRNSVRRASFRLSFELDPSLTLRVGICPSLTLRVGVCRSLMLWVGLLFLAAALWPAAASGQIPSRSAPHDGYWNCFGSFYDGDFKTAARNFREAAKDGIVNIDVAVPGPWIDAIAYHAMIGECHYQMGDLATALDEFTAALKFYLAHRNWMLQIDFPPGIEPETNLKTIVTWGKSSRATTLGHFQPRFSSLTGRLNNQGAVIAGGVVAPPLLYPVYASEIVRCTTLALSRRRELMGPLSEHDPLTAQLVEALGRLPAQQGNWSQCWAQLELGMAYAAANRIPQAISELQKSLLAGERYDHPLTCVALLELGRIAFEQGKYDAAVTYCHEATISGVYFERYDVLEEGFRLAAAAHLLTGNKGTYGPLAPAMASLQKVRTLHISLLTSLAEQLISNGELTAAANALSQARNAVGRRELATGAIGSRVSYQSARASFYAGDQRGGTTALATALTYQKVASKRLFHIGLADTAFRGGAVTERVADNVFAEVLREPTRSDWTTEPLDTLASLIMPHPLPYEHWFELVLTRKDQERALNVAERIRRHRFFSTQPLGGRVLALRWVLEGPAEALSQEATLQRQDLLVKFPKYAELSRRSSELRAKIHALPLAPGDENQAKQQRELLAELGKVSSAQEGMLQIIALERTASEMAFPPLRETKDIQQQLPDGTIVFYYLLTSRNLHAFALAKDRYAYFAVAQPAKVKTDVADMLRLIGNHDRTQVVALDELKSNAWKQTAQRLLAQLTNDAKAEEWSKYRELVIVPDGVLWYLPFEALPAPLDQGSSPLLMQCAIRYSPTLSLTVPDRRSNRPIPRTAIVAGKLLPREDDAVSRLALDDVSAVAGDFAVFRKELPAPSAVFAAAMDRVVVLADSDDSDKQPLGWSPMVLDSGKLGGTVADWLQLPLAGLDQMILPGFHTPAESALKRGGTGDEVFLSVCGLMASGCRTILMSRWRVGGQSTIDLMREFIQELPHESAAGAWRRSVQLASDRLVDPSLEGRLKPSASAEGLKADHPFFWSGYMLVDTGVSRGEEAMEKANK